jgi:pimeloyl-ACP methyl ester carboxylesterase
VQFPVEAYDNWVRQVVPRWTTTDEATIAAYTALVDKVCPCIVLAHSQAGQFGQKVAQARPEKVKALVLVEPAGLGFPDKMDVLKDTPILTVYGDNIDRDARWPSIRRKQLDLLDKLTAAGGHVEVVNLPERGIMGNSHLMMMDKNNIAPAGIILDWLARRGLWK